MAKTKHGEKLTQQPAVKHVLKLMAAKGGSTIAKISKVRGTKEHTTRATISRLGKAGVKIERSFDPKSGAMVYRVAARKAVAK